MRIAVLGAGVAGAFTAWTLAMDGHDVVLIEQFAIGHEAGSSHGSSRVIRKTYPDALHTRLMEEAYPLWDQLQSRAGAQWLVRTGILYIGLPEHPEMRAVASALDTVGVAWRRVDCGTVDAAQGLRWKPGEIGILQEDGGYLRAGMAVRGAVAEAERAGAEILPETKVQGLHVDRAEVLCLTSRGERRFDRVVVCAGAWMGQLLPGLSRFLVSTRQTWGFASRGPNDDLDAPKRVWIDAATHWYGFPPETEGAPAKIARHRPGRPVDPDRVARIVEEEERLEVASAARERLGRTGPMVDTATCLYTNTPDEAFILDHALEGKATIVSACSGHGFKFGPLLGRLAADACVSGRWREDLKGFRAGRFGSGTL
ncbi:MAG: N-methyl-L-tryptophan oxidase [Armatimonadota bacterium]